MYVRDSFDHEHHVSLTFCIAPLTLKQACPARRSDRLHVVILKMLKCSVIDARHPQAKEVLSKQCHDIKFLPESQGCCLLDAAADWLSAS